MDTVQRITQQLKAAKTPESMCRQTTRASRNTTFMPCTRYIFFHHRVEKIVPVSQLQPETCRIVEALIIVVQAAAVLGRFSPIVSNDVNHFFSNPRSITPNGC